jgi:hypothetical protein
MSKYAVLGGRCNKRFLMLPYARSYSRLTTVSLYRMAEKSKMREYKERIEQVEHGAFNALVFTTAG